MRIVCRVYRDGWTKPHHDEYKTDCYEEVTLRESVEDIRDFLANALDELEDLVVEGVDS